MKVLAAHNFYQEQGGEDLSYAANIQMLRDRGHEVLKYEVHNDDIKRIGPWKAARRTFWSHETYQDIKKVMRDWKPDIAHFTNIFPLISPSAYLASQEAGVPRCLQDPALFDPGDRLLRMDQGAGWR